MTETANRKSRYGIYSMASVGLHAECCIIRNCGRGLCLGGLLVSVCFFPLNNSLCLIIIHWFDRKNVLSAHGLRLQRVVA